jgi:hypothetical protein
MTPRPLAAAIWAAAMAAVGPPSFESPTLTTGGAALASDRRRIVDRPHRLIRGDVDGEPADEVASERPGARGKRLLDQLEADVAGPVERPGGVAGAPHAVQIHQQPGIRPDGVASGLEAVEIAVDLAPARVELQPPERLPLLERRLGDAGRILVPRDRAVHLDPVAERAAEERRDGHAGPLPEQVEQGRVDRRDRERREPQDSCQVVKEWHAERRVAADQHRCDAGFDQLDDRGLRL